VARGRLHPRRTTVPEPSVAECEPRQIFIVFWEGRRNRTARCSRCLESAELAADQCTLLHAERGGLSATRIANQGRAAALHAGLAMAMACLARSESLFIKAKAHAQHTYRFFVIG
jgi:hypothetical protein